MKKILHCPLLCTFLPFLSHSLLSILPFPLINDTIQCSQCPVNSFNLSVIRVVINITIEILTRWKSSKVAPAQLYPATPRRQADCRNWLGSPGLRLLSTGFTVNLEIYNKPHLNILHMTSHKIGHFSAKGSSYHMCLIVWLISRSKIATKVDLVLRTFGCSDHYNSCWISRHHHRMVVWYLLLSPLSPRYLALSPIPTLSCWLLTNRASNDGPRRCHNHRGITFKTLT